MERREGRDGVLRRSGRNKEDHEPEESCPRRRVRKGKGSTVSRPGDYKCDNSEGIRPGVEDFRILFPTVDSEYILGRRDRV